MKTVFTSFVFMVASAAAHAADPVDLTSVANCEIQYRSITAQNAVMVSDVLFGKVKGGLDFTSPRDGKRYRFKLSSTPGGSEGTVSLDAAIQDLSVRSLAEDLNPELTNENGYVAHVTLDVSGVIPTVRLASEIDGLIATCQNVKTTQPSR